VVAVSSAAVFPGYGEAPGQQKLDCY